MSTETDLIFSPTKKSKKSPTKAMISPPELIFIVLPLIETIIDYIENKDPILVTENAISIPFTKEEKAISSFKNFDIDRVSPIKSNAKKNVSKSPYSVLELKKIAKDLNLDMKGKTKKIDFVDAITKNYNESKNE
jgi:hypothetical protein